MIKGVIKVETLQIEKLHSLIRYLLKIYENALDIGAENYGGMMR